MKRIVPILLLALGIPSLASGQESFPPPSHVLIDELTWDEIRDLIRSGTTSVIVATAGTEQNGPHMVMGKHRYILEYTTSEIARALGNALVAPIITYVPEGNWEPKTGHMRMPGTISLPVERFTALLLHTGRSLRNGGFTDVIFLEDSGSNVAGTRAAVAQLNEEWAGTGSRAHHITDYYEAGNDRARDWMVNEMGIPADAIGSHAGINDTSQLLFINSAHIRKDALADGGGFEGSGVSGNPTMARPDLGQGILRMKIDSALAQIRAALSDR
jgi:creatinine amidohydrolase